MKYWVIIPARGGSKAVRQKNLQDINGVPLVARMVRSLQALEPVALEGKLVSPEIFVDTDDPQIAAVARLSGAKVIDRTPGLGDDHITLDEVVADKFPFDGLLVVAQPTMSGLTAVEVDWFLAQVFERVSRGTRDRSWALASPISSIVWIDFAQPHSLERRNRQWMSNGPWKELGLRCYLPGADTGAIQQVIPIDDAARILDVAIDIDTVYDLHTARMQASNHHIHIFARVGSLVGSGHLWRQLDLASRLQHHEISWTLFGNAGYEPAPDWAWQLLTDHGWTSLFHSHQTDLTSYADMAILDILDTTVAEVTGLLGAHTPQVITFEDHGPGAYYASLAINALYPGANDARSRYGPEWAVIRPEFRIVTPTAPRAYPPVLITFGGVDPLGLTERMSALFKILGYEGKVTVIGPPGRQLDTSLMHHDVIVNPSMAEEMSRAGIVITSGGRTAYESLATGTPTIVLTQNQREASNRFLHASPAVLHLGLGSLVSDDEIMRAISSIALNPDLQAEMSRYAKKLDFRGPQRIVHAVELLLEGIWV